MRSEQDVKTERCLAVNNQNVNSLTSNVYHLASDRVAEAQNETSILAESVLAQLTNTGYIRFPEQLPLNAKSMTSSQEDDMDKAEKIKVYPNPSQSDVTVEFEEPKKVNAQLYDATGRLVRVFETSSEQSEYTIKGLSHGIYNLRLVDKDGSAENKRIIIR